MKAVFPLWRRRAALAGLTLIVLGSGTVSASFSGPATAGPSGIDKIDHVIVIMLENRSFDHYFGTYPGANGFPTKPGGGFDVCIPDPILGHCVQPYHARSFVSVGGPHGEQAAIKDINHGAMNGFVTSTLDSKYTAPCTREPTSIKACKGVNGPAHQPTVMSYFDRTDIPNYWTYADDFVLQDSMFASVDSYTLPSHLSLMSAWAATCSDPHDPMSCHSDAQVRCCGPYPWTDITYMLKTAGVSWNYYVGDATKLSCWPCAPKKDGIDASTPLQNPMPGFVTVHEDSQLANVTHDSQYFSDAAAGTLPSVSWVMPGIGASEHPNWARRRSIKPGYQFATKAINAAMQSPDWNSTAIFLAWDDWGGFYDQVNPPNIDSLGYGLRVPALVISPYAKTGYIDHQQLSSDAYLKFIEDRFLAGARIDPATDSRPDSRPGVREAAPGLGDLTNDFDFTQPPRPPVILNPNN